MFKNNKNKHVSEQEEVQLVQQVVFVDFKYLGTTHKLQIVPYYSHCKQPLIL